MMVHDPENIDILLKRSRVGHYQSIGDLTITIDGTVVFRAKTLERGWRNNQRGESCVPAGVYPIELEHSNKFKKDLWELKDVPGRSECKFHSANHWRQLNGCIALGKHHKDIDYDGLTDVTNSGETMRKFHKVLNGFTKLTLRIEE